MERARALIPWLLGGLLLIVPASAGAQFRAVALPGDPVPGRPGEVLASVDQLVPLGGDRAVFVGHTLDAAAVMILDDAGVQTVLAYDYDPAPGGGTYAGFGVVYGAGDHVVFQSSMDGQPVIFAWDGATARRVIGQDDPLPRGRTLSTILSVTGSDRGEILIQGSDGVYYQDPTGMAATVLQPLDPVPGDETFTVELIGLAEISTGGIITIGCQGVDASRSLRRSYILQGTTARLAPVASTLDLPGQTGDFGGGAISRSGAIAYQYVYSTDDAGPTVVHRELWIESAASATRVLELVDEDVFPVDGRFMRWGFTSMELSDDLRLFVRGAVDGVSGAPSTLTVLGTEWDVVHRDDQPLPGGLIGSTAIAGVSADGQALLSSGVGDTSGLYLWSASGGLGRLVRPGDILEGSTRPTVSVGAGVIGADGHIAFGAGYPAATGGLEIGGFMTGEGVDAETDLRALSFVADTLDAGPEALRLMLTVENVGPTAAAFEVRLVSPSAAFAEPLGCMVPSGASCSCSGNLCTTDEVIPIGDTGRLWIQYDRASSRGVVATIMPTGGVTELMPADNEIALGAGSGGCAVVVGSQTRAPGMLVLVMVAFLAAARRRRQRVWRIPSAS